MWSRSGWRCRYVLVGGVLVVGAVEVVLVLVDVGSEVHLDPAYNWRYLGSRTTTVCPFYMDTMSFSLRDSSFLLIGLFRTNTRILGTFAYSIFELLL